jgi:hypothetical protein
MEQNKTSPNDSVGRAGKYFKYAIGEIILVVIGILIALQINNWNESKNISKKEIQQLKNLKNDLKADIQLLKEEDSSYAIRELNAAKGMNLFYKAKTVKDIDSVSELTNGLWNVLYINNNTYLQMINSGSMYSMKNKNLQENIIAHYLHVDADKSYIIEVNEEQAFLHNRMPDLYPYKFLVNQIKKPNIDLKLIDTSWIANPNSPTYLAVEHYLNAQQKYNNTYRRSVYKRNIEKTEILLSSINLELDNRN